MCDVNVNNTKLKINEIIQNNQFVSFSVFLLKIPPFSFSQLAKVIL